jgi:hypothetical protein
MMHVASSRRSRGDEVKDGRVDATGCIKLFYPNFTIFFVLDNKSSLVISFSYKKDPKGWWRGIHSAIPLPSPSHSCFLRDMDVLHGVRDERRENERSLQSSKEW